MDRVLQVERFNQRREVVGVGVHLVAIPGLAGPSMAAAVMRDAAVSAVGQKQHLVFPGVRAQGPAMAENYRLSLAPVFIVDFRAVFRPDRRHGVFSFVFVSLQALCVPSFSDTCCVLHPRRSVWPIPCRPGGTTISSKRGPVNRKMRWSSRTKLLVAELNRRENGEHDEDRQNDELR